MCGWVGVGLELGDMLWVGLGWGYDQGFQGFSYLLSP